MFKANLAKAHIDTERGSFNRIQQVVPTANVIILYGSLGPGEATAKQATQPRLYHCNHGAIFITP